MRSSPRCVFDTNVLISALLFDQSTPAQARDVPILTPEKFLDALSEDRPEEK